MTTSPQPTLTPSITLSATLATPLVSVSLATNCRAGPGVNYDYLGGLLESEQAEIVGRDKNGYYWVIKNPDAPGTCWISDQYATVVGPTDHLPVMTPPPTPTPPRTATYTPTKTFTPTNTTPAPVVNFTFAFNDHWICGADIFLGFSVNSTSNTALESMKLVVTDQTLGTDYTAISNNPFLAAPFGCPPGSTNMAPGSTSYVGVVDNDALPGGMMQAYLTLCTGEDQNGTCVTNNINFVLPP